MSSYPSEILSEFTKEHGWMTKTIEQAVSVANGTGSSGKRKIEVLTANYDMANPNGNLMLF